MDNYRINRCRQADRTHWDAFVERSNNGTIMHRQDFLAYHPDNRFHREDLIFEKGEKIVAVLPMARAANDDDVALSPYGSSFGGLVMENEKSGVVVRVAGLLKEYLAARGYHSLRVGYAPMVYDRIPNRNPEYFLHHRFEATLLSRRITSVIDLHAPRAYSTNIKRGLKRAANIGIQVELSNDLDNFYGILEETIVHKHGSTITHTIEELKYLQKSLRSAFQLILAYQGRQPVAGILCFINASPCVCAFYNAHLEQVSKAGALAAVFDFAVDLYSKQGKRFLDLGASSMLGKTLNIGLLQFKEGLGAQHYYREVFDLHL